jgi:hypothetical protein
MGDRRPRQRYAVPDLEFFTRITPESAYWLGFLTADGCVNAREVIIVLKAEDEPHLRSFQRAIGCSDRPLVPANRDTAFRLAIGCADLARQLHGYGVVSGRAYNHPGVPAQLAQSVDFWRGVVDGDGSLRIESKTGIPSLLVVGPPVVMNQFAEFLGRLFDDGFVPRVYDHSQSCVVRVVQVGGRRAKTAVTALYADRTAPALARKRERAERIMAWEPQVVARYPWERWSDGAVWRLQRGSDYAVARRVWESGRRAARERGLRMLFRDWGDEIELQFVPRGTS